MFYQAYEGTSVNWILYGIYTYEILKYTKKIQSTKHKHYYHLETKYLNKILSSRIRKLACHPQKHQQLP